MSRHVEVYGRVTSVGESNEGGEQSLRDLLLNKRKNPTASQLQHNSECRKRVFAPPTQIEAELVKGRSGKLMKEESDTNEGDEGVVKPIRQFTNRTCFTGTTLTT